MEGWKAKLLPFLVLLTLSLVAGNFLRTGDIARAPETRYHGAKKSLCKAGESNHPCLLNSKGLLAIVLLSFKSNPLALAGRSSWSPSAGCVKGLGRAFFYSHSFFSNFHTLYPAHWFT